MFIKIKIISFVQTNLSLMLPVMGAGSAFLLNVFLKSNLPASEYGEFAALLLVVSSLFMIGALGFDNALVRLLEVDGGRLIVRHNIVLVAFGVLFIAPLVSYMLLKMVGAINIFDGFFVLFSFLISMSLLVGVLFKVKGEVASFYMVNSAWKIILLMLVALLFSSGFMVSYPSLIVVSIFIGLVVSVLFSGCKEIYFRPGGYDLLHVAAYMVAALASIAGYAFFDLLDRFVVKEFFSSAVFGDYYFIFTFILSPVGIVAYYFSAKKLNEYKLSFNLNLLRRDFLKVTLLSLLIALFFALFVCLSVSLEILFFVVDYKWLLVVVVALAVVRGGYPIVSMAYTVVCSSRSLMLVGVFFCMLTALIYYFINIFVGGVDIILCSILFPVLWLGRLIVYWLLIRFELSVCDS